MSDRIHISIIGSHNEKKGIITEQGEAVIFKAELPFKTRVNASFRQNIIIEKEVGNQLIITVE